MSDSPAEVYDQHETALPEEPEEGGNLFYQNANENDGQDTYGVNSGVFEGRGGDSDAEERQKKKKKEKKKHKKDKKHKDKKRKKHREEVGSDRESGREGKRNQNDNNFSREGEDDIRGGHFERERTNINTQEEEKVHDDERKKKKVKFAEEVRKERKEKEGGEMNDFIDDEGASDAYDEEDIIRTEGGIRSEDDVSGDDGKQKSSSYFQTVLDNMKNRKRRKRQLSDQECAEYCQKILTDMNSAADADDEAMSEGKPALAKLDMLDFVVSEMGKVKWKYWFVQEGCCGIICRWLAPLKDGSLPNLTIRSRLLELLRKLPISSQELCGNDLGRVLVIAWRHPEETDENRNTIRSLIQAWIRPILGVGSNYKEYRQQKDQENQGILNVTKQSSLGSSNDGQEEDTLQTKSSRTEEGASATSTELAAPIINLEDPEIEKRKHARIPFNIGYKFKVPPKSSINKNEIASRNPRDNPTTIGKMKKMLDGRTQKTQRQAHKVSIEGRGMFQ